MSWSFGSLRACSWSLSICFEENQGSEEEVWRVAAVSFGLTAVGLGVNFAIGGYGKILYGAGASGFDKEIASILRTLDFYLFDFFNLTQMFGAPAYTLYLTHRAIRSWWAYFRAA